MNPQVLIVGAGPTGLVLALRLARHGVPLRIVEKNARHGEASRAIVVHARTLELYQQLGLADEVVKAGIPVTGIHLYKGKKQKARIRLGDMGEGLSPYPFALSYPQDEHERFLVEQLRNEGVEVEWETELVSFTDKKDHVEVTLKKGGAEEKCSVEYLCGCDGAHSTVRKGLKLGFSGGTYEHTFYVADVEATGAFTAEHSLNLCMLDEGFCVIFPVRSTGMQRLIGVVPPQLKKQQSIGFADIQPFLKSWIDLKVHQVNWFSTYHVHHRVADHFQQGRIFICGDAAHIHSPAGGQGMNTGIGDAVNLSWKLAAVLQERAAPSILDSYEPERIAFARLLVSTTDTAFKAITGRSVVGMLVRKVLFPYLMPFFSHFAFVRQAWYKTISQTRIQYRNSMLSEGAAGGVRAGDRLPWMRGRSGDNFEPFQSMDWQLHIYGQASPALVKAAKNFSIPLHAFPWSPEAESTGFTRDAFYLVRPDGHVALAAEEQDPNRLREYLSTFKIIPFHTTH